MNTLVLASFPAMTVLNPSMVEDGVNIPLDVDKGYCRISNQMITIRCFPRDTYEYIHNFYFGGADGEYFCSPVAAVISSSNPKHVVTFGYELGDVVTVDGKDFRLLEDHNRNIKLEEV